MSGFRVHDRGSAPEASADPLEDAEEGFGFIPNLLGVMAASPELLEAYLTLSGLFEKSGLDERAQQVVLLTISRNNRCAYCVAAHSAGAKQAGLADDQIQALRDGGSLEDEALEALRAYTQKVFDERGWVSEDDVGALMDSGWERRTALDVVLAFGMKTLSNYTNHVAETPLDDAFSDFRWEPDGD